MADPNYLGTPISMPPTPAIASSGNASNGLGNGVHANGNANTLPGNTNGIHTNGMGIGSTSNGYFNGVHTNGNGDGINVNDDSESSDTLSMGRNSSTQSQQSAADSSSDGSLVAPATAQSAAASSSDRFLILPAPQPSSIPFIPTLSTHPTIATDAPFVPITGPASSQNYIAPPITLPAPQTSVSPPFQVSAAIYPLASAAAPRVLPSASGPTIIASAPPTTRKIKTNRTPSLIDREERAIANMLTRFRNLVQLAAMQKDEGDSATQEVAATQAFALEVESAALVRGAEDLLQLSRELKELWLFGPLRGIGEGEGEGKIDENAAKVGEIMEGKLRADAEKPASASESGSSTKSK